MKLPENYCFAMKELLGEEYQAYLDSFQDAPFQGLRVNKNKIDPETFLKLTKLSLRKVPWITNGFYYEDAQAPARHPHYYAGLYYLQEPSAMTPANRLAAKPGDRVLDLCAAPGGKATELGASLEGEGYLLANDISISRGRALLKNLEMAGISNLFVTGEDPRKLADLFPEEFDKILIDAPCSGEGMFRRDPSMLKHYEKAGPESYVPVQRELLEYGYRMLAPGGRLLYSTCTFSLLENEENIHYILQAHPDLELLEVEEHEGFSQGRLGLEHAVRIFPHKMQGEGHFLALMQKKGEKPERSKKGGKGIPFAKLPDEVKNFLACCSRSFLEGEFLLEQDQIYYLNPCMEKKNKVRYLRTGLHIGSYKKNRFEPSQAFAMSLRKEEWDGVLDLPSEDPRVVKYLKGETIAPDEGSINEKIWQLICTDGFPLGFAKKAGANLKNKYNAGWRWQ